MRKVRNIILGKILYSRNGLLVDLTKAHSKKSDDAWIHRQVSQNILYLDMNQ